MLVFVRICLKTEIRDNFALKNYIISLQSLNQIFLLFLYSSQDWNVPIQSEALMRTKRLFPGVYGFLLILISRNLVQQKFFRFSLIQSKKTKIQKADTEEDKTDTE